MTQPLKLRRDYGEGVETLPPSESEEDEEGDMSEDGKEARRSRIARNVATDFAASKKANDLVKNIASKKGAAGKYVEKVSNKYPSSLSIIENHVEPDDISRRVEALSFDQRASLIEDLVSSIGRREARKMKDDLFASMYRHYES